MSNPATDAGFVALVKAYIFTCATFYHIHTNVDVEQQFVAQMFIAFTYWNWNFLKRCYWRCHGKFRRDHTFPDFNFLY